MSTILGDNVNDPRGADTPGDLAQEDRAPMRHRCYEPPLEAALLTLAQARAILADPMRDNRYLDTRLGPMVAAYIAWKKLGRPAKTTIDTYERILARLAVTLPPASGSTSSTAPTSASTSTPSHRTRGSSTAR